jgi:hypothetical protein
MKTGKQLAYLMECKNCNDQWITFIDHTFNMGCPKCFDKQTQKESKRIWITIDECTEFDELTRFED